MMFLHLKSILRIILDSAHIILSEAGNLTFQFRSGHKDWSKSLKLKQLRFMRRGRRRDRSEVDETGVHFR
jgi:hypothetical protein